MNFFQPSFKLISKDRIGARVRKTYAPPATLCTRLLSSGEVGESAREKLRTVLATLDPLRLLDEIRSMQRHIAGLVAGHGPHARPRRDADLDRFLVSLESAWREGEVRPTHQAKPAIARHWRTRKDPFESVWAEIVVLLEGEPDMTAKEVFDRICTAHPGKFARGQLRTLQRRVKDWRKIAASRLVFAPDDHRGPGRIEGSK